MPGTPKRPATGRQKLGLLLFACLVLVGGLILAECASRFLCPQWAPWQAARFLFWIYDPQLGWVHRPNQRGRFVDPGCFSVTVNNNSRGLRDDEYPLERTGKKRMLVLGDSFGWGFGVEQNQRFSEILEARRPDWEIINASVAGYATDQEYLFLKEKGYQYQPDVVLVLMYENDFLGNVSSEHIGYNKPFFVAKDGSLELRNSPVPAASCRQRIELYIMGKTYLIRRIYIGGVTFATRIASRWKKGPGESGIQEQMEVTALLMKALNKFCGEKGFKLVLAGYGLDKRQTDCIQAVCSSSQIPWIPLDSALRAGRQSVTLSGDPHWNQNGHRIVAEAMDAFLRQQGIFPPSPTPPKP
jgi:hypothetical protein